MNVPNLPYFKTQQFSPYSMRGVDLYETPSCATHSLLFNVTDLPKKIWEPCAGRGAIAKVCMKYDYDVYQSDMYYYDDDTVEIKDFFKFSKPPFDEECCIITNPPYMKQLPAKMIIHALDIVPRSFFLLRLAFIEGKSPLRCQALDSGHLKNIFVYRDRLPRMNRDNYVGNTISSGLAFAWFEFDRNYSGNINVIRINTKNPKGLF